MICLRYFPLSAPDRTSSLYREDRAHTQSWTARIALSGRQPRRTYPASLEIVWLDLLSQPLKPVPGNTGAMGGVLGISVAGVIQHRPQISALIGQVVAAGVAEHVRPDATELCVSPATRTI